MAENAPRNLDPDPNLKVWINGEIVPAPDAKVSVFEHGLLYGDGVFEGIRSFDGCIYERPSHIKRLFNSAKAIKLDIPYTPEQVSEGLNQALEANGLRTEGKDAYIRLVVTRGVGILGIAPDRAWKPRVIIIASEMAMYPKEMYNNGLAVIISSITRNHPNAMPPRIKSLNYLNNILAKIEAAEAGVFEAIMLNHLGYVAEATADNVFVVREGQLQTPPTSAGALEGITRRNVMRLARDQGVEVVEKDLVRMDLYSADECFLTGTAAQVIPIVEIDKRSIGDGTVGPITRQLSETYRNYVRTAAKETDGVA